MIRLTNKGGKDPAQVNKELLIKLEHNKFKRLKQGQMFEEEYKHMKYTEKMGLGKSKSI